MEEQRRKISETGTARADFDLFQAIVMQAPDAVIFADCAGAIRIWNRGAEAVFGHAAAEILGASLDVIIPERFRAAHWEGFRAAIDAGRTKSGDKVRTTRAVHKDGSTLYVDLSFGLVKRADGTIAGALAVGRDCTARRHSEAALRSRIAELEDSAKSSPNNNGRPTRGD